ncbi:MAG TPA: hypothetical protein VJ600_11260 [Holophagaceae bacterium]|nr:hypothetical protein [Holophagaceae bacterium]
MKAGRAWSLLLLAAVLVAVGLATWRAQAPAKLPRKRVILVDPQPGPGLDLAEAQALALLIQDHLEMLGDLPVAGLPRLPDRLPAPPSGATVLVLSGRAARQGDLLALDLKWCEARAGSPADWTWTPIAVPPLPPSQALQAALDQFPAPLSKLPPGTLLPASPPAFWDLLRASASLLSNTDLEDAVMMGHRALKEAPGCASLHFTVASLAYRQMLEDPNPFDTAGDLVDGAFRKGLSLTPDHPRGLKVYCRVKSDEGRQREALDLLKPALKRHPFSSDLLWAVDYAARTSGLLDLALAARERLELIQAPTGLPPSFGYTNLYAGRRDTFERSLWEYPGASFNGLMLLDRGYVLLLDGQKERAHASFLEAEREPTTQKHVALLAKAYRLHLEGQRAEALAALAELDRQRTGLRVPDGEFTFGMAEAAAYFGDTGLAMDLAHRAFSQGFACATWFERSPMLKPLQGLPRWKALLQHVRERQALLQSKYPPADFGL